MIYLVVASNKNTLNLLLHLLRTFCIYTLKLYAIDCPRLHILRTKSFSSNQYVSIHTCDHSYA
jgi:hypothetical protein